MKGKPASTRSISRWKVDPAFCKLNGMPTNSKSQNGVMMACLDLVVPLHKVKGGEHVGAGHVVHEILNVWNGVLVRNRSIVQPSKIPTGVPRTFRFRPGLETKTNDLGKFGQNFLVVDGHL